MKVANPIYDVVFKYLMADHKIAKFLISKIIGEEILSLKMAATEFSSKVDAGFQNFTVFHLDFAATIKKECGGEEQVLIEIQKAKLPTDIMRFRKYLGSQYQNPNNSYKVDDKGNKSAHPIKTIYFLGHKLDQVEAPFVRVQRNYYDGYSNEIIPHREEFIESLTHDSFIIQIPFLAEKRRNELETLLGIFDQSQVVSEDGHFLELVEEEFPEFCKPLIRRLLAAGQEKDVCQVMEVEDELLSQFESLERLIEEKESVIEKKDSLIEEIEQVVKNKNSVIEEKVAVIEEKDSLIEEQKKRMEELKQKTYEMLIASGKSEDEAKAFINLM